MRRLIGLAVLAASLLSAAPVAADMPSSGLHLKHGAQDAAGCYALELWNGDTLVKTFKADDGSSPPETCTPINAWSVLLPNGHFVFALTNNGGENCGAWCGPSVIVYSSAGAKPIKIAGIGGGRCGAIHKVDVWHGEAIVSVICNPNTDFLSSYMFATKGTKQSTFGLFVDRPGAGEKADGNSFPLFAGAGKYIVFAFGGERELGYFNGHKRGVGVVKDICDHCPAHVQQLVSHGRNATFTANDGHGRKNWVTNGTYNGTHKVP